MKKSLLHPFHPELESADVQGSIILQIIELAEIIGKSERTIYRWTKGEVVPRDASLYMPIVHGALGDAGDLSNVDYFHYPTDTVKYGVSCVAVINTEAMRNKVAEYNRTASAPIGHIKPHKLQTVTIGVNSHDADRYQIRAPEFPSLTQLQEGDFTKWHSQEFADTYPDNCVRIMVFTKQFADDNKGYMDLIKVLDFKRYSIVDHYKLLDLQPYLNELSHTAVISSTHAKALVVIGQMHEMLARAEPIVSDMEQVVKAYGNNALDNDNDNSKPTEMAFLPI